MEKTRDDVFERNSPYGKWVTTMTYLYGIFVLKKSLFVNANFYIFVNEFVRSNFLNYWNPKRRVNIFVEKKIDYIEE